MAKFKSPESSRYIYPNGNKCIRAHTTEDEDWVLLVPAVTDIECGYNLTILDVPYLKCPICTYGSTSSLVDYVMYSRNNMIKETAKKYRTISFNEFAGMSLQRKDP